MSSELTIFGRIEVYNDQIDLVKVELLKLVEPSLLEAGCKLYALHQDNENAAVFVLHEEWVSRELWQQHMKSKHLTRYLSVTQGRIASFTLNEMVKL